MFSPGDCGIIIFVIASRSRRLRRDGGIRSCIIIITGIILPYTSRRQTTPRLSPKDATLPPRIAVVPIGATLPAIRIAAIAAAAVPPRRAGPAPAARIARVGTVSVPTAPVARGTAAAGVVGTFAVARVALVQLTSFQTEEVSDVQGVAGFGGAGGVALESFWRRVWVWSIWVIVSPCQG